MITTAPGVPAVLETDKQRLRQILYNLLSNAVKFTDHGRVELHIDTAGPGQAGADTGSWVVFSVTDTGIGIGRDNLGSIFSAFQQADGTTSRRYGGTGLGLAICREVAARLGGEVTVRSELGVGSTFSLRLPLAVLGGTRAATPSQGATVQAAARPAVQSSAATVADVRPVPAARAHAGLAGHRILVVDDDPRNAFVLTDVLEMHGMTVVQATDGRKAIAALGAGRHRPGADGRDDAADGRLRDHPRDPQDARVRQPARHHRHCPRHAGRPGEEHRRRRHRLHHQADRHRGTPQLHGTLAIPAHSLTP